MKAGSRRPDLQTEQEAELKLHTELFEKLKYHLPAELASTKAQLEKRLAA